jgi:hypothetical protein
VAAHEDDGRHRFDGETFAKDGETVRPGHPQVGKNDLVLTEIEPLYRGLAVPDFFDFVRRLFESAYHQPANRRVIVDYKNACHSSKSDRVDRRDRLSIDPKARNAMAFGSMCPQSPFEFIRADTRERHRPATEARRSA